MWRAATDFLPTKKNLQKWKITQDPTCDRCGDGIEDGIHAIWGCQMVKQVWWELENCREYLNEKFASFHDLLQGILAQKNPKLAELFGFIGWSIWYERNARRMGTPSLPMKRIYRDAVECMKDFQSVQEGSGNQTTVPHPTPWLPPLPSVYKVNFDGATFQDTASVGLEVLVCDSNSLVIAVLSVWIHLPPTMADLEALACKRAILFATEIRLQDVVFECDSEVIFKLLTADQPCMSAFGHIIEESRFLAARLKMVSFTHTKH